MVKLEWVRENGLREKSLPCCVRAHGNGGFAAAAVFCIFGSLSFIRLCPDMATSVRLGVGACEQLFAQGSHLSMDLSARRT